MMSLSLMLYPLVGFPTSAFAAPPEGKGQGQGNGNGNQGNRGNSDQAKAERGQSRADVVSRSAERAHSKQAGGKDFYSKKPGDYGQRELPIQASDTAINSFSKRSDAARGREASLLRDQNRRIVEDFEKVIGKLREHKEHGKGKDNARWNFNPKDDRGQGNNSKHDMLDPYGHSKDDRMELYGNRGRVIRQIEEILSFLYTNYLYVDGLTFWVWLNYIMGWGDPSFWNGTTYNLTTLGYSAEEAAFLYGISSWFEIFPALMQGYVAMDPVETTVAPISELDLNRILNYVDSNEYNNDLATMTWDEFVTAHPYYDPYAPGDATSYTISLTNPYDTPLTLSVESTITYLNQQWTVYNRDWSTLTFETQTGAALPGDSTQTWDTVTIQPGETIYLYDTYDMPTETVGVTKFIYKSYPDQYAYGSVLNGYSYDVTITDLSTGLTYNDPAAGWFGYTGVWNISPVTYESQ